MVVILETVQRRGVAKNVGCFHRRLFVCVFVCQHDNFRTSKHRMMKLGGRCTVQKSRPSSNSGGHSPWVRNPEMWRSDTTLGKSAQPSFRRLFDVSVKNYTDLIGSQISAAERHPCDCACVKEYNVTAGHGVVGGRCSRNDEIGRYRSVRQDFLHRYITKTWPACTLSVIAHAQASGGSFNPLKGGDVNWLHLTIQI